MNIIIKYLIKQLKLNVITIITIIIIVINKIIIFNINNLKFNNKANNLMENNK